MVLGITKKASSGHAGPLLPPVFYFPLSIINTSARYMKKIVALREILSEKVIFFQIIFILLSAIFLRGTRSEEFLKDSFKMIISSRKHYSFHEILSNGSVQENDKNVF